MKTTVKITSKNFMSFTKTNDDGETVESDWGTWHVQYIATTENGNYVAPYSIDGVRDLSEQEIINEIAALYS